MAVWFTFANGGPSLAVGAGGWYNANVIAGTGMSNGAAVANTTFDIADTGLYLDPYISRQAPHWEAVPEGKAFLDSQRYWWPCRNLIGASASTYGPARGRCVCPVPMRTAPSVAIGLVGGNPCYGWDAVAMNPMTTIGNYSTYTMLECDCNSATASYATGRLCQQLAEYPGYLAVSARM